jgi:excisionase family DNA binding protein
MTLRIKESQRKHRSRDEFSDVPELLTAIELEALLKINRKTIYSYVQRGLIPYVRMQSNVRFLKSQIIEWIQMQTFQPRS